MTDGDNHEARAQRAGRSHRVMVVLAVSVWVVALGLFAWNTIACVDVTWVDAIGGSLKTQRQWQFGLHEDAVVATSLLEARYREMGLEWQPRWGHAYRISRNLLGQSIANGSSADCPPVFSLAGNRQLQEAVIATSTDEELRELFKVCNQGTLPQQRGAVMAAHSRVTGPK